MKWEKGLMAKTFLKIGRAGPQGRAKQAYSLPMEGFLVKCQDQAMVPGFVSPRSWDRMGNSQEGNEKVSLLSSPASVGVPSGQVRGRARRLCYGSAPQRPSRLVYPSPLPREAHFVEYMVTDAEFVLRGQ